MCNRNHKTILSSDTKKKDRSWMSMKETRSHSKIKHESESNKSEVIQCVE